MLVSCPKCSSRYKLPDDKIRPSGTKVRCPRCQNTFRVFPEAAVANQDAVPAPFADASGPTEAVVQAPLEAKVKRPSPAPVPAKATENFDYIEGAKTVVSPRAQAAATTPRAKPKEPSPFKRPVSDEFSDSAIDEATEFQEREQVERQKLPDIMDKSEPSESAEPPSMRPFGDATFAEIQQASSRPSGNSKKYISWTAGGLVLVLLLGYGFTNFKSRPKDHSTANANKTLSQPAPVKSGENPAQQPTEIQTLVKKSPSWYRDDPSFYQDFLTQTATLPISEQQKPENRALLADALISNGMLTGAEDQIMSGLGIASALLAGYPTSIYGYYGLFTYAAWKEEVSNLLDLVKSWPVQYQNGPEYRLAKAISASRTGPAKAALEDLKNLIAEYPEYFRTQMWTLLVSLDHSKDAEDVIGKPKVQEMIKKFEKRRGLLKSGFVPTLYTSIERRLRKKGIAIAEAEPKAEPSSIKKTDPNESGMTAAPARKTAAIEVVPTKQPKIEKTAKKKNEKGKKVLPKAEPELIALNQQTSKMRQAAMKLFQEGSLKQRENKIDEAITLYQNALREDPDLADVYKQLGVIYMNRQEKERALRAFKIYLQLKPESDDRQVVQAWISSMQ